MYAGSNHVYTANTSMACPHVVFLYDDACMLHAASLRLFAICHIAGKQYFRHLWARREKKASASCLCLRNGGAASSIHHRTSRPRAISNIVSAHPFSHGVIAVSYALHGGTAFIAMRLRPRKKHRHLGARPEIVSAIGALPTIALKPLKAEGR